MAAGYIVNMFLFKDELFSYTTPPAINHDDSLYVRSEDSDLRTALRAQRRTAALLLLVLLLQWNRVFCSYTDKQHCCHHLYWLLITIQLHVERQDCDDLRCAALIRPSFSLVRQQYAFLWKRIQILVLTTFPPDYQWMHWVCRSVYSPVFAEILLLIWENLMYSVENRETRLDCSSALTQTFDNDSGNVTQIL